MRSGRDSWPRVAKAPRSRGARRAVACNAKRPWAWRKRPGTLRAAVPGADGRNPAPADWRGQLVRGAQPEPVGRRQIPITEPLSNSDGPRLARSHRFRASRRATCVAGPERQRRHGHAPRRRRERPVSGRI